MATVYVAATGSASSPDPTNPATPWTLTKALQSIQSGDTALINDDASYADVAVTSSITRSVQATIKPAPGKTPVLGEIELTNVSKLKFEGADHRNFLTLYDDCWDITYREMRSRFRSTALDEKRLGGFRFLGSGGGRWLVERNRWAAMTWRPSDPDNQNGPYCVLIDPGGEGADGVAPEGITITGNYFGQLGGFDAVQFRKARRTTAPVAADYFRDVVFTGNEMDALTRGGTKAHADPVQFGGFFDAPYVAGNRIYGGTRGILFLPNARTNSDGTRSLVFGRTLNAVIENNLVVLEGEQAQDFCLQLTACDSPSVLFNTLVNFRSSSKAGLLLYKSNGGSPETRNVLLTGNVIDYVSIHGGTVSFQSASGRNVIANGSNGAVAYVAKSTDSMGVSGQFADRPNAIPPRQVSDFLVTGGAARNKVPTGYATAEDLRGYARSGSTDAGALDADATDTGLPADTTAPTVTLSSPVHGLVVEPGTVITLGAQATDDRGVAGVQFQVDAVDEGAEELAAPYSIQWDTTGLADGDYSITAVARDAADNTATSSPVVVTVQTAAPAPPADLGSWGPQL